MPVNGRLQRGERRSAGALTQRRIQQPWPSDRDFRILSIDGGGIRGVYPATVLAELESRYTGGEPVAKYFDLIAGTSTGGILALGLGAGLTASELRNLYVEHGSDIFPPLSEGVWGGVQRFWRKLSHLISYRYDRDALQKLLRETLGNRLLGESGVRLCIPAFEARHSEVFVYKTPHHPDYQTDRYERMLNVALGTAAAPTFFRPFSEGGYLLVDGGVWANNPVMLAVVEALTCFDVDRGQVKVLSLGCGDDPYVVSDWQIKFGGLISWRDAIFAAMRLQSLAATNQARLLLGAPSVHRVDAPANEQSIALDDWRLAVHELVPGALAAVSERGDDIARVFLHTPAEPYLPCPA